MNSDYTTLTTQALRLLCERCPRLTDSCYWAGTSAISLEVLRHRQSFDLDFHTLKALADTRPLLAEIKAAFPGSFALTQSPDEYGSGFQGVLTLPGGEQITLEVLANYEEMGTSDLTASHLAPPLQRVALERYLADKIQCVVERAEARDLVDIHAVLRNDSALIPLAKQLLAEQDATIAAERLLEWTDDRIAADLKAYTDAPVPDAIQTRDRLLTWLKEHAKEDCP